MVFTRRGCPITVIGGTPICGQILSPRIQVRHADGHERSYSIRDLRADGGVAEIEADFIAATGLDFSGRATVAGSLGNPDTADPLA